MWIDRGMGGLIMGRLLRRQVVIGVRRPKAVSRCCRVEESPLLPPENLFACDCMPTETLFAWRLGAD
jgi:hypothetical protein